MVAGEILSLTSIFLGGMILGLKVKSGLLELKKFKL
jgi:hypothetical protein